MSTKSLVFATVERFILNHDVEIFMEYINMHQISGKKVKYSSLRDGGICNELELAACLSSLVFVSLPFSFSF